MVLLVIITILTVRLRVNGDNRVVVFLLDHASRKKTEMMDGTRAGNKRVL